MSDLQNITWNKYPTKLIERVAKAYGYDIGRFLYELAIGELPPNIQSELDDAIVQKAYEIEPPITKSDDHDTKSDSSTTKYFSHITKEDGGGKE